MASKQEYRAQNLRWLEEKRREEGIERLADGVYCRVLSSSGSEGRTPSSSSIVVVHYTGWTIDGRQFDTSRGDSPLAVRLRELVEGWIIALQEMRVGDRWELYLDASRCYGGVPQEGIPAWSTLIFDIELLNVL